jgi:hypothetical protein
MRYSHTANEAALKGGQPNSPEDIPKAVSFHRNFNSQPQSVEPPSRRPHHLHPNILTSRYILGSSV